MTEPTHEYYDQIDADVRDVLDACYLLLNEGYGQEAVDALRLSFAAVWWDAAQQLVKQLMAGDTSMPANPFMPPAMSADMSADFLEHAAPKLFRHREQ